MRAMLAKLVAVLEEKIEGDEGHPWIPGAAFADGKLVEAITEAKAALGPNDVEMQAHRIASEISRRWAARCSAGRIKPSIYNVAREVLTEELAG